MNSRQIIHQVYRGFQNNPGLILLAVCGVAAVLFMGMIFFPRSFRRLRRRLRGRKRSTQA